MSDPADHRAAIRCAELDLTGTTVRRHVTEGMHLTHLGIEFNNVMRGTLDSKAAISKLKRVGLEVEEELPDEDPLARLDAEFALLIGTLRAFLAALSRALGGYAEEAAAPRLMAVGEA